MQFGLSVLPQLGVRDGAIMEKPVSRQIKVRYQHAAYYTRCKRFGQCGFIVIECILVVAISVPIISEVIFNN